MLFQDRQDAGKRLAQKLEEFKGTDAVVLALPRGGVVVGYEIAKELRIPLDVIITRKIGAPGNPEYAIGAIAETGEAQLNEPEIHAYGIPQSHVAAEIARQREEINRRIALYRDGRPLPDLKGRTVIVVDDGIATGFTMKTAIRAIWARQPQAVVLAVPVAPRESIVDLSDEVTRVVCLATPEPFFAVGAWYRDFTQVTDEEVRRYLDAVRLQSVKPRT